MMIGILFHRLKENIELAYKEKEHGKYVKFFLLIICIYVNAVKGYNIKTI